VVSGEGRDGVFFCFSGARLDEAAAELADAGVHVRIYELQRRAPDAPSA
jgi:hypothetical protein